MSLKPIPILIVYSLLLSLGIASLAGSPKPNVILILTDDQGYGELGSHGHPQLTTPHIDRLRDESIRMTDFHVSSKCSPTRGALMTGRHCKHVGVREADNGRNIIGREFSTAADIFLANGYRTGIFGKWHLGGHYPFRPQDRGFQEVLIHGNGAIGTTGDIWGNDYYDDLFWHNGEKERYEGYCTDIWFEEAMAWMKETAKQEEPFFCYLPTNAPHGPFIVPEPYAAPYRKIDGLMAERLGMMSNIDENVGKLMRFLEASGLEEETILIYMTDNGAPRIGDNAGMRGWKGTAYDGGHRVPFIIRWPEGGLGGGKDIDVLTAHIDLLPTLIDLCSLSADGIDFDGMSFKSLFSGESNKVFEERVLIESYSGVVLTEEWRLVNGEELYLIQRDPAQANDLASKHPELVKRFRKALQENQANDYDVVPRIIVGSDQQPYQEFTLYHWFDLHGFYNNKKITQGERVNGVIPIEVARAGKFRFTLRRWPKEMDLAIRSKPSKPIAGFKLFNGTDKNPSFAAIDIRSARLKVAQFDQRKNVGKTMSSVSFLVDLKPGESEIQTGFRTADGETLGAYYLDVQRLGD